MQTKQIQKELVNGVDVPKLTQIIDELTQNPDLAQFNFCVKFCLKNHYLASHLEMKIIDNNSFKSKICFMIEIPSC